MRIWNEGVEMRVARLSLPASNPADARLSPSEAGQLCQTGTSNVAVRLLALLLRIVNSGCALKPAAERVIASILTSLNHGPNSTRALLRAQLYSEHYPPCPSRGPVVADSRRPRLRVADAPALRSVFGSP